MVRALVAVGIGALTLSLPSAARAANGGEESRPSAGAERAARKPAKMITYDRNLPLRVGLLVAGTSFLAISYGVPCARAGGHWCIPYGGPVVAAVKYHRSAANADSENDGIVPPLFVDTLLVGVAAVQLASSALILTGALLPRREVTEPLSSLELGRRVALTPVAAPSVVALVASGRF